MAFSWDFDAPDGVYKNHRLAYELYKMAAKPPLSWCPHGLEFSCPTCYPPVPLWRRLKWIVDAWIDKHAIRVHRGPCCDHDPYDD